jgi:hypothetical protein
MNSAPVALFCDDVRTEESGKHILVGVYPGDLVPRRLPITVRLAVWIRLFRDMPVGNHSFEVRLRTETSVQSLTATLDILEVMTSDMPYVFAMPPTSVRLSEPGTLTCTIAFDGEEPTTLGSLLIRAPEDHPVTVADSSSGNSPD